MNETPTNVAEADQNCRKEITKDLSKRVERMIDPNGDTRVYWSKEVTIERKHRVDYMQFVPVNNSVSGIEKGDFFCYEIKSSVADFHSPHGHNYFGDYNYYVMPKEVFDTIKDEIPFGIGVFCPSGKTEIISVKRARRRDRSLPTSYLLLMMFRSAARDRRRD